MGVTGTIISTCVPTSYLNILCLRYFGSFPITVLKVLAPSMRRAQVMGERGHLCNLYASMNALCRLLSVWFENVAYERSLNLTW